MARPGAQLKGPLSRIGPAGRPRMPRTRLPCLPEVFPALPDEVPCDPRPLILDAIDQGRDVTITYVDGRGEQTLRRIRPMEDHRSYVRAQCRLRGEDRSFRYDRIGSVDLHEAGEVPEDSVPF